jgi:hypothetical protein
MLEFKELERERLNLALANNEEFHRNLVVDNDSVHLKWNQLFDPVLDEALFGKTGLPDRLWKG